jgi:hypothetical protein
LPQLAHPQGMAQGGPPPLGAKSNQCHSRPFVQLEDVTAQSGIHFEHILPPEARTSNPKSKAGGTTSTTNSRNWCNTTWEMARFVTPVISRGPAILEPRVSRGLAVADLFNDGQINVVIENLDGRPTIL